MASVAAAFDRAAADYDRGFGRNPVGRLYRHVFQERALAVFPPGSRLLDLGCGTGEDALLLASRGREVLGLDVSPGMISAARGAAERRAAAGAAVRFVVSRMEAVAELGVGFDGAYSDFGALNCADLGAVGRGLQRSLRGGAPLLLSLMGPRPLPAELGRLLRGRGEPRGARAPRVAGIPVEAAYPAPAELRRRFGPEFSWSAGFALGVVTPDPEHEAWAVRNPHAFGVLAALEGIVRRWPLLKGLGDHNVLEGRRR